MIQLFNVSKQFPGSVSALSEVSFQVEKGEFVFIAGPSGAGKTTLLRLLFCEEKPSIGQILVDNTNLSRMPRRQIPLYRRQLGVIFQDFRLIRYKTVADNVALPLEILGVDRELRRRKTLIALKEVGLAHKIGSYPPSLSGGEQQRVAIARAIIGNPKIILADEPTGNLDAALAGEIMKLLEQFNVRGTTVLVATHDDEMIARLGRRVIQLERGALRERRGDASLVLPA
jgi:cell division transport system ATP-binding protein